MEIEIWKDIKGYEGYYQVSNFGEIRWLSQGVNIKVAPKKRKIFYNKRGYGSCCLSIKQIHKTFRINRIVAQAFIPNPENKPEVNHINGIKTDNTVTNLEWNTRSENQLHSYKIGLISQKGEKNGAVKITQNDANEIREMKNNGIKVTKIMTKFNLAKGTIYAILQNKIWNY